MKEDTVDVFDAWLDSRLRDVHTVLPGIIDKYYGHTERKARVKPQIRLRTVKGDTLEIKAIDGIPVVFPSSGKFSLLYPLNKGDGCLILFSEEGIGSFLKGKTEVTADSLARFSLTDAICIPGLWSFPSAPESTSTIEIDDNGNILLNGSSKRFVTHAELNTALQDFIIALNLHTHPTAPSGPVSPPSTPMSIDISAAETQTVRTDG